jgi:hypothetical protein
LRTLPGPLDPIDARLTQWMARNGIVILRVALGIVFFWFGVLMIGATVRGGVLTARSPAIAREQ